MDLEDVLTIMLLLLLFAAALFLHRDEGMTKADQKEFIRKEVAHQIHKWSPTVIYGKYVTVVDGAEIIVKEVEK